MPLPAVWCIAANASGASATPLPPCAMRRFRCIRCSRAIHRIFLCLPAKCNGPDASGALVRLTTIPLPVQCVDSDASSVVEWFTAYSSASMQMQRSQCFGRLSEAYYPPPSCAMRRFRCVRCGRAVPHIPLPPCKMQRSRCFGRLQSEAYYPPPSCALRPFRSVRCDRAVYRIFLYLSANATLCRDASCALVRFSTLHLALVPMLHAS
jgi:hypothetical protein